MPGPWLARIRWRRRGAWLWPAFVVLTLLDGLIGHWLPPTGDGQSIAGAALVGVFLNLIAVILLSRPFGGLLRRRRADLPSVVARNYGGTVAVVAVSASLLVAGLIHRPAIASDSRAMQDAIARAMAWIGDRAPAEFRRNVRQVNAFAIQPGSIYRACVPSADRGRTFCVIVNTHMPFGSSVRFDGYESNRFFAVGAG